MHTHTHTLTHTHTHTHTQKKARDAEMAGVQGTDTDTDTKKETETRADTTKEAETSTGTDTDTDTSAQEIEVEENALLSGHDGQVAGGDGDGRGRLGSGGDVASWKGYGEEEAGIAKAKSQSRCSGMDIRAERGGEREGRREGEREGGSRMCVYKSFMYTACRNAGSSPSIRLENAYIIARVCL